MSLFKYIHRVLLFSGLGLLLVACGNDGATTTSVSDESKTKGEFSVPTSIRVAALPAGATLVAKIYVDFVDENSVPLATKNLVFPVTGNIQFELAGITLGDHTFTVIFEYTDDPDPGFAGTFELARISSAVVNVVTGANTGISFSELDYDTSADADSDGVSNLEELSGSVRTNPNDSTCILDGSVLGSCVLG